MVAKSNVDKIVKPVEEIIILLEKREEILHELREASKNWNTIKYLNF